MWLNRIEIQGFRNIEHAELEPANGYNLITGVNGSGKTSILEAIHCLSTGRSFRTNKKQPIIRLGANQATVYGEVTYDGHISRAGIMKRRDGSSMVRIDGRTIEGQSELALLLPVLGVTPEGDDLISEGSKVRQAYIDWTLFHVEQNFRESWRKYRRALLQRNHALRDHSESAVVRTWDEVLVTHGAVVDSCRKETLSRLIPIALSLLERLLPSQSIRFSYRQGWGKEQSLSQSLEDSLNIDRKMGFTHCGPHRADLVIKTADGSLLHNLSRGQQKLLTLCMKLSQVIDFQSKTGSKPILFIDDLPAELDMHNREAVVQQLCKLETQSFITSTSTVDIPVTSGAPVKVFHVEQGKASIVV